MNKELLRQALDCLRSIDRALGSDLMDFTNNSDVSLADLTDTAIADLQAAIDAPEVEPEQVDVFGVKPDGSTVNIGKMTMPPRMKARELATEQFGHFEDDDGSDASLCYYALERLIDHMPKPQLAISPDAQALRAELERVKGERDAMALDAKRYRMLRDDKVPSILGPVRDVDGYEFSVDYIMGDELDAEVDVAIAQGDKL